MTALDQIRAKVEEVRREHGLVEIYGLQGKWCASSRCNQYRPGPCEALRWAEAAWSLTQRWGWLLLEAENALVWHTTRGMKPSKTPMWNVSQAKELKWTAEQALADIAQGLK